VLFGTRVFLLWREALLILRVWFSVGWRLSALLALQPSGAVSFALMKLDGFTGKT